MLKDLDPSGSKPYKYGFKGTGHRAPIIEGEVVSRQRFNVPSTMPERSWSRLVPSGTPGGIARVPNVPLPVMDVAGDMMTDLRTFGRLAAFLRRGNPYLTAAELAVQLWQNREWVKTPGNYDPGSGWERCPTPSLACWNDKGPADLQASGRARECAIPIDCANIYNPSLQEKLGTAVPAGFTELSLYKRDVTPGYATHVAEWIYRGVADPPPNELRGSFAMVSGPPLVETVPEGVTEIVALPDFIQKFDVAHLPGARLLPRLDGDLKVVGRPSNRLGVHVRTRLSRLSFVPMPSGEVQIWHMPMPQSSPAGQGRPPVASVGVVTMSPQPDKKSAPMALIKALKVYHAVTEAGEAADAVYSALPKAVQRKCGAKLAYQKAICVVNNWREIDLEQAIWNLAVNELSDQVIGAAQRRLQRLTNRKDFHGPAGMQLQQWMRTAQQFAPRMVSF